MLSHTRSVIIVLVLFQGVLAAGCGDHGLAPTTPSTTTTSSGAGLSVTTTPAPAPATLGAIVGFVVDTAFRPLEGAKVEIMSGNDAGYSTTADAQGHFTILARFDGTTPFRATLDGYSMATDIAHSSSPGGQRWIVFYMEPSAPSVNIAGDYTLTMVADSACTSLPVEMRTRSYRATIAEAPHIPANNFSVTVQGVASGINQSFSNIGVAGNDLGFDLSRNHNGVPTLVEQLAPDAYLWYLPNDGFAGTSADSGGSTISTSFDGTIDYVVAGTHAVCASAHHRLILTRR